MELVDVAFGFDRMPGVLRNLEAKADICCAGDELVLAAFASTLAAPVVQYGGSALLTSRRLLVFNQARRRRAVEIGDLGLDARWEELEFGQYRKSSIGAGIDLRWHGNHIFLATQLKALGPTLAEEVLRIGLDSEGQGPKGVDANRDDRHLHFCTFLGGYGTPFEAKDVCSIHFRHTDVIIRSQAAKLMRAKYAELTAVEISGPGAVTSGGGFIGGGFGLEGAVQGMAAAAILNTLTTRTTITTVVTLQFTSAEMIFYYGDETPDELRITLSPLFGKLRSQTGSAQLSDSDPIVRLERLASLLERGALTQAEYDAAKAKVLGDL